MITVNSRRFDGTIRKTWQCELLEQRGSLLIAVGEFDTDIEHADLGRIKKGTISREYYWLDRWYNIFRFHEPSGEFRNFYCNVSAPAQFENGVLDYVDLDIDVLIDANSKVTVLDREDYERSIATFGYPVEVQANVELSLHELLEFFDKKEMPGLPELFATSGISVRESG
jgi:protein associated with RNAse G/E